jgi:copper homeostasis protein
MILEVCIDSVESARAAAEGGAHRIELCADLHAGGVTPSAGLIASARRAASIILHVMIRPRAGDFCYNADEFGIMKQDILSAKKAGADGVVFGILHEDNTVDVDRTSKLVAFAHPMAVTFHRAFDIVPDPMQGFEDVIRTGAARLLTSGCRQTAPEGAGLICELQLRSAGRIALIAGSGVYKNNVRALVDETGVAEVHVLSSVSRIVSYPTATLFDAKRWVVEAAAVKEIVEELNH